MSNYLLLEKLKRFVDERSGGIERMAGDSNKDLRHEIATEVLGRKSKSTDISLTAIVSALVTKLGGDAASMARIEQESFIRKAVHPRANDVNVGSKTSPVQIDGRDGYRENGFWFMKSPLGGPMGGNFIRELGPGRSATLDAAWENTIPVTLQSTINRMKREIIQDVLEGHVPVACASFVSLHDHRDANSYGGFCDDQLSDSMIEHFGGRDKDEGMPDGFVNFINQAQEAVDTWLVNGGLATDCPPPGWSVINPADDDPFDLWGRHPYTSVYEKTIGGNGSPTCALTVLREGNGYRPAHGSRVMEERVDSATAAADIAMTWAVENGWSNAELSKANPVGNALPIPAFSPLSYTEHANHVVHTMMLRDAPNLVKEGTWSGKVLDAEHGLVVHAQ